MNTSNPILASLFAEDAAQPSIATDTSFRPIPRNLYQTVQSCFASGKFMDIEDVDRGCFEVRYDGDETVIVTPDGEEQLNPGMGYIVRFQQECYRQGGFPAEFDAICFRTGEENGEFGVYKSTIDITVPPQKKEGGLGWPTLLGIGVAVLGVGGLVYWGMKD